LISKKINVNFDGFEYPILIGKNIIDNILDFVKQKTQNKKIVIVSDEYFNKNIVNNIYSIFKSESYEVYFYFMDAGKGNKSFNEVLSIYELLEKNEIARDSTIISIGGGVIGDLAGFVASTWFRGMNLVHIPTTLTAMVDSSIGGKVAVNLNKTINAVGNYHHPILNLIDLNFIETLSDRDYKAGIAEIIKCAIISDENFFNYLIKNNYKILNREEKNLIDIITRSIEIKINHVEGDVREGNKRLFLNYGHTLGHSVEISTQKNGKETFRHGEGVAIGIMAVDYIANIYFNTEWGSENLLKKIFDLYNLPSFVDSSKIGFERTSLLKECLKNVKKDKKRINNNLRLILSKRLGEASAHDDVPFSLIEEAFDKIIK
tara:strand:- start:785 stop:1909 length:1125 start_codon:yes stop_codon:yes gene_type:complete